MKKTCMVFLIIVIMFLSSCRVKTNYKYLHDENEIVDIYISRIFFVNEINKINFEDIRKIESNEKFLKEFNGIDCYVWWGDPVGLVKESEGDFILKLVYSNGDNEYIGWNGQATYTSSDGFKNDTGFHVFDENQFKDLLGKYL